MDCPACQRALIVVEREGIEVDWCLSCRGLWFDGGELELLAGKSGRKMQLPELDAAVDAGKSARKCPRCRQRMRHLHVGEPEPVELDLCAGHGLWLDRGELARVMVQLETEGFGDEHPVARFLGETFARGGLDV